MSLFMRRLILIGLGILSGLVLWPVLEIILLNQVSFPSYFIFTIFQGALFGVIIGAIFGSGAGITASIKSRSVKGAITGAFIGLLGGVVGFLIGQGILYLLGNIWLGTYKSFQQIGLPVSRALGWAFLGIFIGMSEGFRSRSLKKITIGLLGGFIGGLMGGFAFEYLKLFFPGYSVFRLAGLLIFGFFIGLFYCIIERGMSHGILQILNGKLKGKQVLINQNRLSIGNSVKNDLALPQYSSLAEKQVLLKIKKKDVILNNLESKFPVFVNDERAQATILKYGDVIKIGTAKLYYTYE